MPSGAMGEDVGAYLSFWLTCILSRSKLSRPCRMCGCICKKAIPIQSSAATVVRAKC